MAKSQDTRLFQIFVTANDGPGGVVALNRWADAVNKPPAMGDDKSIFAITPETFSLKQFRDDVDRLVNQLEALKLEAEGIFAAGPILPR